MSKDAPRWIPKHLMYAYSMSNTIPIYDHYINETESKSLIWDKEMIEEHLSYYSVDNIEKHPDMTQAYDFAAFYHVKAIKKFSMFIHNKHIAVIGSLKPWIEAILLNMGAKHVTTVEYNVPFCSYEKISTISYDEFEKSEYKYDAIFSYSSIEHSGLGRYGDPLNPNGDIETMNTIYDHLQNNGLVFIGIPVGKDCLVWNAHRVYGESRLKMLFEKFEEIEWIGLDREYIKKPDFLLNGPQPVIILRKKD